MRSHLTWSSANGLQSLHRDFWRGWCLLIYNNIIKLGTQIDNDSLLHFLGTLLSDMIHPDFIYIRFCSSLIFESLSELSNPVAPPAERIINNFLFFSACVLASELLQNPGQ